MWKKEESEIPQATCLEHVALRLRPGIEEANILEEMDKTTKILSKYPGFLRRTVAKKDDLWLDILEWASLKYAQEAAKRIMDEPEARGFMQCMELDSIEMKHLYILRVERSSVGVTGGIS